MLWGLSSEQACNGKCSKIVDTFCARLVMSWVHKVLGSQSAYQKNN